MREEDMRERESERSDSRWESSRQATGPSKDLVQAAALHPINHPAGTEAAAATGAFRGQKEAFVHQITVTTRKCSC